MTPTRRESAQRLVDMYFTDSSQVGYIAGHLQEALEEAAHWKKMHGLMVRRHDRWRAVAEFQSEVLEEIQTTTELTRRRAKELAILDE